jgi:hypothetical protein
MKKIFLLMAAASIALTSCTIKVVRSGENDDKKIEKSYNLNGFTGIAIAGSTDLKIVPDTAYSVVVKGTNEALNNILTEVEDSVLIFRKKEHNNSKSRNIIVFDNYRAEITVHMPVLKEIKVAGTAEIECDKPVVTDSFRLEIAGSGDVEMDDVVAKNIQVSIAGSGNVELNAVGADIAELNIAGSGNIKMKCKGCNIVRTNALGSGHFELSGDAKKFESASGKADIKNLIIKQ